jgi:hypothetical protein
MSETIKVNEVWTPPEWMKPGWISMNEDGSWYWSKNEPKQFHNNFAVIGPHVCLDNINWTPPRCDDWRQSKRRIEVSE